jgi:hypothetical protein
MANIRRCYNENCQWNIDGSYCDGVDIVIDSDGCCEDFQQKESEELEDGN